MDESSLAPDVTPIRVMVHEEEINPLTGERQPIINANAYLVETDEEDCYAIHQVSVGHQELEFSNEELRIPRDTPGYRPMVSVQAVMRMTAPIQLVAVYFRHRRYVNTLLANDEQDGGLNQS